jgi:RNA polymerase sigma factor (sigma-70 family)
MSQKQLHWALGQVQKMVKSRQCSQLSDHDLLNRFVREGNESAFAAIVHRHGAMVRRVCQSVLRHVQDAEDASQATFLVLARSARSIRKPASLASWLHGVAYRLALKVKADRQNMVEPHESTDQAPDPKDELSWREVEEIVHQEINRLPGTYRAAVILCCVEGLTLEEAAHSLGATFGTVKGRLTRGRELLRRHLQKRGISLMMPLLTGAFFARGIESTAGQTVARCAMQLLRGEKLSGGLSRRALVLAETSASAMPLFGIRLAALAFAAFGLLLTALGAAAVHVGTPEKFGDLGWADVVTIPVQAANEMLASRADFYGDPLPVGAIARIGTTRLFRGHNFPARRHTQLAYSPDGKTLFCWDWNLPIVKIDVKTGKETGRFAPNDHAIWQFALAPDGKTLVTAAEKNPLIRLWGVESGKVIRTVDNGVDPNWMHFSPDGESLAVGDVKGIQIWNAAIWEKKGQRIPVQGLRQSAWLPDGKTIVTLGSIVQWHDTGTGHEIRRMDKKDCNGNVALSADGRRLAGVENGTVLHVWDAATGQEKSRVIARDGEFIESSKFRSPKDIGWDLLFSSDARILVCLNMSGGQVTLVESETGQIIKRWKPPDHAQAFVFSPNGRTLALAAFNQAIHFVDTTSGRQAEERPRLTSQICTVVGFTTDGQKLVTSTDCGSTGVWDPFTGNPLTAAHDPPQAFVERPAGIPPPFSSLSADATKTAIQDGKGVLHVWQPHDAKVLCRIEDPPVMAGRPAFSPDGKTVSVRHSDGYIRLWDAIGGKLIRPLKKIAIGSWIFPQAFSADGRFLAFAPEPTWDGRDAWISEPIALWDVSTGASVAQLKWEDNTLVHDLAFSGNGRYLFSSHTQSAANRNDGYCVRVWELTSGRELRRLSTSKDEFVTALSVSPDSKTLAAAVRKTVILWEIATGKERGRFTGHQLDIGSLAFSPDGRLLASASRDYTALVWDITGTSPDGKRAVRWLSPIELEKLWADLADDDGAKANAAIWTLVAAPRQSVPLVAARLKPLARTVEDKEILRLVGELDSDLFKTRAEATEKLTRIGEEAEPALVAALAGKVTLEARRRIELILALFRSQPLSLDQLRHLRALEVLEHTNTPQARQVLSPLARGAPGRLTSEASESVARCVKAAAD